MALDFSLGKGKGAKPAQAAKPKNDLGLKVVDFFEKNPLMKIIIPLVLFVVLAAVFVFIIFGDGIIAGDVEDVDVEVTNQQEVDVWTGETDIVKDKKLVKLIEDDPLSADILASAKYTGYIVGSSGLKTAQIEIGGEGDCLVLTLGASVGDSEWVVQEITKSYVVFKAGDTTKKIDRE